MSSVTNRFRCFIFTTRRILPVFMLAPLRFTLPLLHFLLRGAGVVVEGASFIYTYRRAIAEDIFSAKFPRKPSIKILASVLFFSLTPVRLLTLHPWPPFSLDAVERAVWILLIEDLHTG